MHNTDEKSIQQMCPASWTIEFFRQRQSLSPENREPPSPVSPISQILNLSFTRKGVP